MGKTRKKNARSFFDAKVESLETNGIMITVNKDDIQPPLSDAKDLVRKQVHTSGDITYEYVPLHVFKFRSNPNPVNNASAVNNRHHRDANPMIQRGL